MKYFGFAMGASRVPPVVKRLRLAKITGDQKMQCMDESKNPWTIFSEKKIYANPWIEVTEFGVINPGGGKGIYGKVHFKKIAVGALPLDDDFNVYLVGQYRFVLDQYSWEIPEGGVESGEDPLIGIKRELLEETGLVAGQWQQILTMHLSNSVSDELAILYLATRLQFQYATPEETESLVVKKIPFDEAFKMVEAGVITDSMSVAAIQKVRLMMIEGAGGFKNQSV
jgi:8-oxo-dGTP pyrophosphatase MutT (NUDIX family)